jgi:hypothetical protein
MPEGELFEDIKRYLPPYLSPRDSSELFAQLAAYPSTSGPFYLQRAAISEDEPLQGDGWRGFVALDFQTADRKELSGVVISNSCDIDPANRRDRAVNILFSPLIALSKYVDLLRPVKTDAQIENVLTAIRSQKTTSIFHLPEGAWGPESIILLDTIHAHPLDDFLAKNRARLFTLSMYAFYIFIMKLSIHFMRMQENVRRFDSTEPVGA